MKKIVILMSVILNSLWAHAMELSADHRSYYEQLLTYFTEGTLPADQQELLGWWTGRCYQAHNPSNPVATVLVAVELSNLVNPGDHGPLFPPEIRNDLKLVGYANRNFEANYFDHLSARDKANMEYDLNRIYPGIETVIDDNSYVSREKAGSHVNADTHLILRKYQNYWITQSVLIRESTVQGARRPAGYIWQSCYYFQKID